MENFQLNIIELQNKYNDNPYILQRLQLHLTNLPSILELENKKYDERLSRHNCLVLEQDTFHKVFLGKYQYYYMPFNNIFYEYDGKSYKIIKEDDIHYHLLSTITDEGKLIQWKHKTKQTILKKIKERTLFKSVPETNTIQTVLGFLQTIFQTKIQSKYFLTLLGDCILKKNTENLLFFVTPNMKKIISLIDSITYVTAGVSIINHFITKFHDSHNISLYRLVRMSENSNDISYDIIKTMLNTIGIDLFTVATHYSERYTNSEYYLNTEADETNKNYILYFVNNNIDKILTNFVSTCITTTETDNHLTWKNMHYIWKIFLNNNNIPNMMYVNNLQQLLSNKLTNISLVKSENGNLIFENITSKYLPNVSSFLNFWEKYILITGLSEQIDDEFEIDELSTLYKSSDIKNLLISDSNMIKMISHYFSPQVEIIDNKYITNIKCILWSKQDDIKEFLSFYKSQIMNSEFQLIQFDDLYQGYKQYFKSKKIVEKKHLPIVSKHFFEKYLVQHLSKFIQFDKFVSSDYFIE